jgi:hypothetical protein
MQPATNKNNLQPNLDQVGMQNHRMGNTNNSLTNSNSYTSYITAKTSRYTKTKYWKKIATSFQISYSKTKVGVISYPALPSKNPKNLGTKL